MSSPFVSRRQRRREHDDVVLRQLGVELVERDDALEPGGGPSSTRRRTPVHARRARRAARAAAPPSPPTPTISARTRVHLAQHRVEPHERRLVPLGAPLLIDREVEPAQKVQHARDDVLGDRDRVDAGRVREQHVARDHLRIERAAHAGGRRVNPAQPLAPRERAVAECRSRNRPRRRESRPSPRRSAAAVRRRRSSSARARRACASPAALRRGAALAVGRERPVLRGRREVDDEQVGPDHSVVMLMTSCRARSRSHEHVELLRRADELELEGAVGVVLEGAPCERHGRRSR